MTPRRSAWLSLAVMVLAPLVVEAQQSPRDRTTRTLIQTAMEDYQNLEIDRALERLNIALRGCGNGQCSNAITARVQMSIGIVMVGGQQDSTGGVAAMVRALQLDSNVEPDALMVTPEITAAFRQAQQQSSGGSSGSSGSSSGSSSGTGRTPPRPSTGGGGSNELLHTPAPEQLENTPLPVYVEASGPLDAAHVYVFYRGNGMRQFRQAEMTRVANGYGTEIPCGQVIQPSIDYYVQAQDASGNGIASAGSESAPVHVNIVTSRSHPAPSLPGRMPPEACGEECPPGVSGPQCRRPARRPDPGDPCSSNSDCGDSMHCDAGACAAGGGGGDGPPGGRPDPGGRFSRFAIDVGGGVGLAFLSGRPAYAEQRILVNSMGQVVDRSCGEFVCSTTIDPGFSPTGYLAAFIRYNPTRRIGVGVGVRFQFGSADWSIAPVMPGGQARSNPFANLLLTARMYYAVTPSGWAMQGVVASVFGGGGVGQIEPTPALPANVTRQSAHVLSGYGNAQFGGRVEYNTRSGFHVGGELAFQFMFPTFLFDMDITGFVGFHL